ncbi:histidine phosphatase family protein [Candidatus Sumerlaeota bacterium]|nr:histidine phosphatase family protein [Candidatus Sumerlaeota bacterium]
MPAANSKTTLYMIRHGEPAEEFKGRFYGQMDVPLSDLGKKQSIAVAQRLSSIPFDAIYSSDLQRAGFLADTLAEPRDLPVRRLEVFRERHFGIMQGMTEEEMLEAHPERHKAWKENRFTGLVEGGENFDQLQQRILPAVQTLVEAFEGGRIALVAHGGPIRVVMARVLGMPIENIFQIVLDYACVNVIEYSHDGPPKVKLVNG